MLLAVDTSTDLAGVALYDGDVALELAWRSRRNHARQLMPTIRESMAKVGVKASDLAAVAAARGPGSFTGLRVGLAVARGLAFSLDVPLYGIPSLEVVAASQFGREDRVHAVLAAGRGRFATATYERRGDRWIQVSGILGVDLDELVRLVRRGLEETGERCTVAGELTSEARSRLAALGPRVEVASPAASVRRPAVLAELAWSNFAAGRAPRDDSSDPIYLSRG